MIISDRVTGAAIAALGAAAAYAGSRLPPVPGQQVGPSAFPVLIGLGLLACGTLVALGIGQSFEEPEKLVEADDGAGPLEMPPGGLSSLVRVGLPPVLLLFYVFASEPLGFVPTAAIMIFTLALAFRGGLKLAIILALVGPVLVHLVFYKLLRVPLPPGLLPMPW